MDLKLFSYWKSKCAVFTRKNMRDMLGTKLSGILCREATGGTVQKHDVSLVYVKSR